jgi:hypothetical protein
MAENPAYWTEAEKVIYKALKDHAEDRARGVIGFSAPAVIYRALREADLLKDSK